MRRNVKLRKPVSLAIGASCLMGLGLSGCARESLGLSQDDPKTHAAVAERANDSIRRSRQELATNSPGKKGGKAAGGLAVEPEDNNKPKLASGWKTPIRSAGKMLSRKSPEVSEDPFLALGDEVDSAEEVAATSRKATTDKASKSELAANTFGETGKGGLASFINKSSKAAKQAEGSDPAERKVAMAEPTSGGTDQVTQTSAQTESSAALEDFLKSQTPVDMHDRKSVESFSSDALAFKPGTSQPADSAALLASRTAPSKATAETEPDDLEQRLLTGSGGKSTRSKAAARPFPAAGSVSVAATPARKDSPKAGSLADIMAPAEEETRTASASKSRKNPLLEEPVEEQAQAVASADERAEQSRRISGLLKKARKAGDQGEFSQALGYAVAARELAQQCGYEFASNEASPDQAINWISDKLTKAEAQARTEKKKSPAQTELARKPLQPKATEVAKAPAADPFASVMPVTAPVIEDGFVADTQPRSKSNSTFNEWASGVGLSRHEQAKAPEWPELSSRELARSDEQWMPQSSLLDHGWTRMSSAPATEKGPRQVRREVAVVTPSTRPRVARSESLQAAVESPVVAPESYDRVQRVAGTWEEASEVIPATGPRIELGAPTDFAPEAMLAQADTQNSGVRRGSRLASPPPLMIDDDEDRPVATRKEGKGRELMMWMVVAGAALVSGLVGFSMRKNGRRETEAA